MSQNSEVTQQDQLAEVDRLKGCYDSAVSKGSLEDARRARAALSDFIDAIGQGAPEVEEQLRRELNFPVTS